MSSDYARQGFLNENQRVSAAFMRERLRRRNVIHPESPAPSFSVPPEPDAEPEAGKEPGPLGPSPGEPITSPPQSS